MQDTAVAGLGAPEAVRWGAFVLEASDDAVKADVELRHRPCGVHLCDAQDGDSIGVFVLLVVEHAAECASC